ncbi:hypothetical protein TNCV_2626411 [Trichonephila clavipes]|uniref:Uncharacterized protein n=1 Tax=Trichonephila clavipes TaxID=2585209 RepID=A0A8X6W7C4_TRICX|nr:hypothetical protein TNCV_2626411 [Trichonephila clavipes]
MWNPQKAGYLLRNILSSKVVKTNLKGLPYQLFCYQWLRRETKGNDSDGGGSEGRDIRTQERRQRTQDRQNSSSSEKIMKAN